MDKIDFGFQQIPIEEKAQKVGGIFHAVAGRYDLMNDLMSLGMHRLWKQHAIKSAPFKAGDTLLDVASGTGDLVKLLQKKIGSSGKIYSTDINESMLSRGRDKLIDQGIGSQVSFLLADAENLPFNDNYFDGITIAFGLRNVTRKTQALASMARVLKPGGCSLILEFSQPVNKTFRKIYDAYSFKCLPTLGQYVAGSKESYQYLVESIRRHPDQETLRNMILHAGFARCDYENLSGGIVAIHKAYKA